MNGKELIETRPELFDGYDGTERTLEQQKSFDSYVVQMMESAPDYIKQAAKERQAAQA